MTAPLVVSADPATYVNLERLRMSKAGHLAQIMTLAIESPDDYTFADELLTECTRERDALVEQRGSVTKPLYQVVRTVESWFKPSVDELDRAVAHLKQAMGGWRVLLDSRERSARQEALEAAKAGNSEALHTALNEAHTSTASVSASGRARVRFEWHAAAVDEHSLPDAYWTPDLEALAALAKHAGSGDTPPAPVPGVTWARRAIMGVRR